VNKGGKYALDSFEDLNGRKGPDLTRDLEGNFEDLGATPTYAADHDPHRICWFIGKIGKMSVGWRIRPSKDDPSRWLRGSLKASI
jgi:hypothetical protein